MWTWISYLLNHSEFDNLIGHANNLNLGIWLYQFGDGLSLNEERERLLIYSFNAWKLGYLTRVERKWIYLYECQNQDPCDCDPNTLS
jgi:hypothetical protein